jgi:Flp pilus assembly pilin Flp
MTVFLTAINHLTGGNERGTVLAEWALLVVLIAIVAIVGVTLGGEEVSGQYSNIASSLDSV